MLSFFPDFEFRASNLFIMSVFFFLLGAIMGSFANALIFRFGNNRPILRDQRSYCDHCGKTLPWFDLIPLASFLLLGGRCRSCKNRIPWWTFAVELFMAFGFVFAARMAGVEFVGEVSTQNMIPFFVLASFVFGCVFFFFIDLVYMIIPDHVSLSLIGIGVVGGVFDGDWSGAAAAGILGAGFFLVQYLVSRGHWVGGGDIRLGAFLGVYLGVRNVFVALALAYGIGLFVALWLLATKRMSMQSPLPFGTLLMVGGISALVFGDTIVNWYLNDAPLLLLKLFG